MSTKINFTITAMLSTSGEATIGEKNDDIFVNTVNITPVFTIISSDGVSQEDQNRIRMLALHSLVQHALKKLSDNVQVKSVMQINMNPTSGESN